MAYQLRVPIVRRLQSLAPYHYTLDPGTTVFLIREISATSLFVSEEEHAAHRISEDNFVVARSEVEEMPLPCPA